MPEHAPQSTAPARSQTHPAQRLGGQGASSATARAAWTRYVGELSPSGGAPIEALVGATDHNIGGAPATAKPRTAGVYEKHEHTLADVHSTLTPAQAEDLQAFIAHWTQHRSRYEAVAGKTGVPAALVAAIHWRESSGRFDTYLHQGDPLGRPAVHVPTNIPVFHVWEDAAVHALKSGGRDSLRDELGMDAESRDPAAMATYAEFYNGLGYDAKGRASPYVYSGTSAYTGGKYVSDGNYSPRVKDQQIGVVALVGAVDGADHAVQDAPVAGPARWDSIKAGRTLQAGMSGPLVAELQRRLAAAGYACGDAGRFDEAVTATVRAFQHAQGFTPDGIVGPEVAQRLEAP